MLNNSTSKKGEFIEQGGYIVVSYRPMPALDVVWYGSQKYSYAILKYNNKYEDDVTTTFYNISVIDGSDPAVKDMYSRRDMIVLFNEEEVPLDIDGRKEFESDSEDDARLFYEMMDKEERR